MLGNIAIDLARFLFLYVEFYIPYGKSLLGGAVMKRF